MSKLTETALDIIEGFEIRRVRDLEGSTLKSMKGPEVDGIEQRNIIDIFTSDQYLKDDLNGNLASFVVMAPTGIPLIFFSLRCGELFEETSLAKMQICHNAYIALYKLGNNMITSETERKEAIERIRIANSDGMSIDDFEPIEDKKHDWQYDDVVDANKEINKVFKSHPAVELKLFGVNAAAENYWKSLRLPNDIKMGETLFWLKVVKTLETIMQYVGCRFAYLFAANKEAEGRLVKYYRVRLGFNSSIKMTTNKPRFDWNSQFLFQSINDLFKRKSKFVSDIMSL